MYKKCKNLFTPCKTLRTLSHCLFMILCCIAQSANKTNVLIKYVLISYSIQFVQNSRTDIVDYMPFTKLCESASLF